MQFFVHLLGFLTSCGLVIVRSGTQTRKENSFIHRTGHSRPFTLPLIYTSRITSRHEPEGLHFQGAENALRKIPTMPDYIKSTLLTLLSGDSDAPTNPVSPSLYPHRLTSGGAWAWRSRASRTCLPASITPSATTICLSDYCSTRQ